LKMTKAKDEKWFVLSWKDKRGIRHTRFFRTSGEAERCGIGLMHDELGITGMTIERSNFPITGK
jgi:hypothetical protein